MKPSHRIYNTSIASSIFGIIISALFIFFPGYALSQYYDGFQCSEPEGMQPSIDYGPNEIKSNISLSFEHGDFKSLIDAADMWKTKNCLLKNGETRLGYWLSGFTAYFKKNKDWGKSLEQIEKFKAAYPKNVLPLLAEARYWSDYANDARGFGYASSVSAENWKLFKDRLQKSEEILFNAKAAGSDWPIWYWQTIRVEALLGRPLEERNKLFLEGTKKFKDEVVIYSEMSYYLEPRWGGNWAEVDNIVTYATKTVQSEPPDATYTRMYWARGDMIQSGKNFFSETKVSWPRMRAGFISLLKIYPQSTLIGNNFLSYTCLAEDKETYLEYRKILTLLDIRAWRSKTERDQCDTKFGFTK